MDINLLDSGKITVSKNGKVQNILPFGFFHRHPRNSNAVLITSEIAPIESKGISVNNITLDSKKISIDDFLNHVSEHKGNNGSTSNENIAKALYLEFSKIDNFEAMNDFIELNKNLPNAQTNENGKVKKLERRLGIEGFSLNVILNYEYNETNPNYIDKIVMRVSRIVQENISEGIQLAQFDSVVKKINRDSNNIATFQYLTEVELSDLYKVELASIDNYEDMLVFARKHQNNVGGINMQNNRLVQEEIRVDSHTLQLIITLTYYYISPSSNQIVRIGMSGTVSNIDLTQKVYKYDTSGNVIGYEYKNRLEV